MYASLLRISRALHLDVFEQPEETAFTITLDQSFNLIPNELTQHLESISTYNAIYGMSRLKNRKKLAALCLVLLLLTVVSGCCFLPHRMEEEEVRREEVVMVVTAYCPCGKCCAWKRSIWSCWLVPVHSSGPFKGKRKKVGITADGTRAKKGVIAADISKYPYGTRMYVPGYGWGVVHDRGREMQGNRIDVFFEDHDDALRWGKQKLTVTVIR